VVVFFHRVRSLHARPCRGNFALIQYRLSVTCRNNLTARANVERRLAPPNQLC